jgi:hypothetical protein
MRLGGWLSLGLVFAFAACGSPDPAPGAGQPPRPSSSGSHGSYEVIKATCPQKPIDPSRPRVMVVDHGFDVRHPIFKDKIAGCYTVRCPEPPDFKTMPGETEDAAAARMAAMFATPAPSCTVEDGVSVDVDSYLEHFDPDARATWNEALFDKHRIDSYTENDAKFMLELTTDGENHGTATAGAIAFRNDVDIVLVDIALGSLDDVAKNVPCLDQKDIDLETRLLSRDEVASAYVHAPLGGFETALLDLRSRHGVGVENHSFGPPATKTWEFLLASKGCALVDLEAHEQLVGELDAQRDTLLRTSGAFDATQTLVFESAGNDALQIDEAGQISSCTPGRVDRELVGAYEVYRGQARLSFFTNYGACDDLYALGESVILPTASQFYGVWSGTSFSSPLAARFASSLALAFPSTAALRDRVRTERDANRFLDVSTMPTELSLESTTPIDMTMKRLTARAPMALGPRATLLRPRME